MLKYNEFCDELLEKVDDIQWLSKTINHCLSHHIPMTHKISKALYNTKISAFHVTDPLRIGKLKQLTGSRKSLSCFTKMSVDYGGIMDGVQTYGGLLLQLEGNLVLSSYNDIMSMPDEQGRRWIAEKYLSRIKNNTFFERFKNVVNSIDSSNISTNNAAKKKYISTYIEKVEKFVIDNTKDFLEFFLIDYDGSWNELLLNEITVKDVLILDFKNQSEYIKDKLIDTYGTLENCEKLLKSFIKGEIYIADCDEDGIKFVHDRGGIVKQ